MTHPRPGLRPSGLRPICRGRNDRWLHGRARGRPYRNRSARARTTAGIRCEVAAPSTLQKPAGQLVKTDARDGIHLARLLRLDQTTAVAIPSLDQEAAADLVRAGRNVAVT